MKSAIKLNEVIKNSKFEIIKNAGHEVNIDNPKEFANTIYNFWKRKLVTQITIRKRRKKNGNIKRL